MLQPVKLKQRKDNAMLGTDWDEILNQIDRSTVPTHLVEKIVFYYDDEPEPLELWLDQSDAESLAQLGPLLSSKNHVWHQGTKRIEISVNTQRMKQFITKIVDSILSNVPKGR
jgi:hypothetical protein